LLCVFGIYLLAIWPVASDVFLGLAIGTDLICDGIALMGFAGAIHTVPSTRTRAAR
jgi:uncharacterized membrane protein HdeD (DUF308 family)